MSNTTNTTSTPNIINANLIDEQGLKTFWGGVKSYIDEKLVDSPIINGDAENSTVLKGEYIISSYTYNELCEFINSGWEGTSEGLYDALQQGKNVYIKFNDRGGKITCDYTLSYYADDYADDIITYHIHCDNINFSVDYNDTIYNLEYNQLTVTHNEFTIDWDCVRYNDLYESLSTNGYWTGNCGVGLFNAMKSNKTVYMCNDDTGNGKLLCDYHYDPNFDDNVQEIFTLKVGDVLCEVDSSGTMYARGFSLSFCPYSYSENISGGIGYMDAKQLHYLLNPINFSNIDSLPSDMLESNDNEFDIKEKYIDTRYFVYKDAGIAYSVMSIYYTGDKYEFTMAEGCPKQKYTWDSINGALS